MRSAIQLSIYAITEHQNPLNRFVTAGILENNFGEYDREKDKEMLLDAAETILGIFNFDLYVIWLCQGQKVVDAVEKKCNERRKSRSRWKMIKSTESNSYQTTEAGCISQGEA